MREKIKTIVATAFGTAFLTLGVQSLAQRDPSMGAHGMGKMQPGAMRLHEIMMESARQTMSGKMPMDSDTDRAFAKMMVPHHEAAVRMARVELQYGNDPATKRMAKRILDAQTKEIPLLSALGRRAR